MHGQTTARLAFLQQVLDALPSSVYLVHGHEARLLLANRTVTSLWGAEWPVDQPMVEFLASNRISLYNVQASPLAPEQYATLSAVRLRETVQQQETIRRPDGSSIPVLVTALPLDGQPGTGQLAASKEQVALVVHQDVSALAAAAWPDQRLAQKRAAYEVDCTIVMRLGAGSSRLRSYLEGEMLSLATG